MAQNVRYVDTRTYGSVLSGQVAVPVIHAAQPAPPRTPAQATPYASPRWVVPTGSIDIVNAIANVMQRPPSVIDQSYVDRAVWVAGYLKVPIALQSSNLPSNSVGWATAITRLIGNAVPNYVAAAGVTSPITIEASEYDRSRASAAQSNVLNLIQSVHNFADRAKAAGFSPPDNPFTVLASWNTQRGNTFVRINVPQQYADDLVFNMKAMIDLLDAFNQGAINLGAGSFNMSQLSHVHLSFDGLGGSGNTAADIKKFLPSIDDQKREQARLALEVLDFSKRVPYLLFTLDYVPQEGAASQGGLLGWKKIPDASGYIIKRHAVFSGEDREFNTSNASASSLASKLMPYARSYALSMFDNIDERSVIMYLDSELAQDEYYVYKIQAYQVRNDKQETTFTVTSTPVSLTPTAKRTVRQYIATMSSQPDRVSPWPAISEYLYGNSSYDWILAAVNIRASTNRRDAVATTRQYSYLSATPEFLEQQADAGRLVKPADVQQVIGNITDSIQQFGVSQTVQNMLDETGITYYFDGRDQPVDPGFHRAGMPVSHVSRLFDSIAGAIDPETATLDLKHLASNMAALLAQQLPSTQSVQRPSSTSPADNRPTELMVPDPNNTSDASAEGSLQFIDKLGKLDDSVVDLTTFDGLSKFMRALRILSDAGSAVDGIPVRAL